MYVEKMIEEWRKKGIQQEYQENKSSCSCRLSSIKGILFGGISSRFWMLRKHLLTVETQKHKDGKVPFLSW